MTLTATLATAASGIFAAQTAIDVVSQNIANVSTEGYTRKIHNQSNRIVGSKTLGVRIEEVTRVVTEQLQRQSREQSSVVERLEIIDNFLGRLEFEFGRPEDGNSIAAKMTELKEAFQALSTSPEDSSRQISLVLAAQNMARSFNDLNGAIQKLRAEADARISNQVAEFNTAITNIDKLNDEISANDSRGRSTANLRDQRDVLVEDVNEKMSIRAFERLNGEITILGPNGQLILDDSRFLLSCAATPNYTAATTGQPLNITILGAAVDITASVTAGEGSISGLLSLRDSLLPNFQQSLDDLAFEIATNLGTVNVNGTNENVNLFTDATGTTVPAAAAPPALAFPAGFAGAIQVRTAIVSNPALIADPQAGAGFTPAGPADPSIALAIIGVFEAQQQLSLGPGVNNTMEGFAAQFIATVANQKADTESQLTFQTTFRNGLRDRLNDQSAVNTDEELTELIKLEAAFAASARILTAVQRAVDELLEAV